MLRRRVPQAFAERGGGGGVTLRDLESLQASSRYLKVASSVEALAEAFEGTLRELRRLRRHLKGASKPSSTGPSNSISQAPPLRYLPEGPLTDCLGAVVWKARELDFKIMVLWKARGEV